MQIGDMDANTITMLFKQRKSLRFRFRTAFPQFGIAEHVTDRHPGRSQASEKLDPYEDGCIVVALARSVTVCVRKQPDPLVIADSVS